MDPLIDVIVSTYNHGPWLAGALDGVLGQKTHFAFRILLIDDASTDDTCAVARRYHAEHPDRIVLHLLDENSGRARKALFKARPLVRAKYFALLDGDDYWCTDDKLERQLTFMEDNPRFVGCAHNTRIDFGDPTLPSAFTRRSQRETWSIDDMAKGTEPLYCHSSSWVWRNIWQSKEGFVLPPFMEHRFFGDVCLSFLFAQSGPMKYFDEVMSVYRHHGQGVWSSLSERARAEQNLALVSDLDELTGYAFAESFALQKRRWQEQISAL